ncbi:MAG: ankyrin repeat domain-containing protein [Acidobacteria bacterium]|nr:ankyrin repeat domain-containing protein [Acidobacteriota bacterium]
MRPRNWIAAGIPLLSLFSGCFLERPHTALTAAAAAGRAGEVAALLEQGADPNVPGGAPGGGFTPLDFAARDGRTDIISLLLKSGADPDLRSGLGDWTPLMHAIHKNQEQSLRALLNGGANVNARGRDGLTALIMAAGYGYSGMVRELLDSGADPYAEMADGNSALTSAVGGVSDIDRFTLCSCQTDTVQTLLEEAPDLRLKDNFPGRSARWFARLGRCSEVLRLLEQYESKRSSL